MINTQLEEFSYPSLLTVCLKSLIFAQLLHKLSLSEEKYIFASPNKISPLHPVTRQTEESPESHFKTEDQRELSEIRGYTFEASCSEPFSLDFFQDFFI